MMMISDYLKNVFVYDIGEVLVEGDACRQVLDKTQQFVFGLFFVSIGRSNWKWFGFGSSGLDSVVLW